MGRDISTEETNSTAPKDSKITLSRGADCIVPFVGENISRCKCPDCPVQADSQCAQDKIKTSREAMEYMPAGSVPKSEPIPGVYCSSDKATCQDLNFERQCICGSCEVWKDYNLKDVDPNNHFCQHGKAT